MNFWAQLVICAVAFLTPTLVISIQVRADPFTTSMLFLYVNVKVFSQDSVCTENMYEIEGKGKLDELLGMITKSYP